MKKLWGFGFIVFLLSGCESAAVIKDTTPPYAELVSVSTMRNETIDEDTLFDQMVIDVTDDNPITISNYIEYINYDYVDFSKVGEYDVGVKVTDDAGNFDYYYEIVTVTPNDSDLDPVLLAESKVEYKMILDELSNYSRYVGADLEELYEQLDTLTLQNYTQFGDKLETLYQSTLESYRSTLKNRVSSYIQEDLNARNYLQHDFSTDKKLKQYVEEYRTINLDGESFNELDSINKQIRVLMKKVNTRLHELDEKYFAVPVSLQDNKLIEVADGSTEPLQPNVKVNISNNGQNYFAYTNNKAQLVMITADKLYNPKPIPDTKLSTSDFDGLDLFALDKFTGRMIPEHVGGVANAYNPSRSSVDGMFQITQNDFLDDTEITNLTYKFQYMDTYSTATPFVTEFNYKTNDKYEFNDNYLTMDYTYPVDNYDNINNGTY